MHLESDQTKVFQLRLSLDHPDLSLENKGCILTVLVYFVLTFIFFTAFKRYFPCCSSFPAKRLHHVQLRHNATNFFASALGKCILPLVPRRTSCWAIPQLEPRSEAFSEIGLLKNIRLMCFFSPDAFHQQLMVLMILGKSL